MTGVEGQGERPVAFADRLTVAVTLTIGGTEHALPGGSVKHFDLDLRTYGFSGAVEFVIQDDQAHGGGYQDDVRADFVGPDLIEISVELSAVHWEPEMTAAVDPITVAGLVTRKSMSEVIYRRTADLPILVRRYRVEFADPACVLWSQHFPCQLYTDKSLADVIADHAGDKISITCEWSALSASQAQVFLHLPPDCGASFYDFIAWYTDTRGGVLTYDYSAGSYKLTADKPEAGATAKLFGDDIERADIVLAEVPRHQPVVLNSYADDPRTETVEQAQAASGIRHDHLIATPIAQSVDDRVTLEKALVRVPAYEAELSFARTPTVALAPGAQVEVPAANRWSADSALVGKTWRVRRLWARGTAPAAPLDHDAIAASTGYTVELSARLEQSDDARVPLPAYRRPCYPGHVEGKVVSEQGEDPERTYQVYRDADTSLEEYKVKVPLWDDQQVNAPFEPHQGSGNVYIPAYRDARVLVAMGLHSAYIARLLDWRDGAPLSMDVQGEQILLGKSETSNTSVNHVYDGDNPVFNVARTHASDTSLIQLREGTLFLQVKEDSES